ncbi:hypothetical protein [Gilvimarinus polysaccharolyticus]|uniref:hypothetical protein n=1 Tax=Gilvimarinus polysaccharolyticus TaxID=863921 RepID=UPI0012FC506F|nr:hypothetical protein [Gilvimarinus polysaccharolyticus]
MTTFVSRWKKRMAFILATLAIVIVLTLLGFWMIQSPERARSLSTFAEVSFWWFTASRWIVYTALIVGWPRLVYWFVETFIDAESRLQVAEYAMRWRWPLLRVLIVYELLFPFNFVGYVGNWL